MKTKLIILPILMLGIIVACAEMNPHPMDMSQVVQNAKTKDDHNALAEHYEAEAEALNLKVNEHKKLLEQYQAKSYLYGRQASNFRAHCEWLINAYSKASELNSEMAKMHREMAQ
jgi:hypothetical protein